MEFANPWLLLLIPLVVLPWFVFALVRHKRRSAVMRFSFGAHLKDAPRSMRVILRWLPDFIRFIVLSLLVAALAGPRIPSDDVPIHKEGIDIVLAFDISTSMMAMDFEPSDRFTVARETMQSFIDGRKDDRLGLVVFSGEAFTQCPLTLDYSVLKNIMSQIRMGVIEDGTAIGDALGVAINRLRNSEARSKVVVLLTDGDNNAGKLDPRQAARMAAELGIRVHTIQVGRGGVVPYPVEVTDPFTGQSRRVVRKARVDVDPQLLRDIAETTKGMYRVAADSEILKGIFKEIDSMERTELPGEQFVLYDEIYSAFALPALLLLLGEILLGAFWLRKFP